MKHSKTYKRLAIGVVILLLLAYGPFSYSRGHVEAEVRMFDKYFSADIDLIPIIDSVLKDNTVLKATVKELVKGIEFRDAHINEQREVIAGQRQVIAGQDVMLGDMADEILELENRPPEIVEVEKIVYIYVDPPTPEPEPFDNVEDDGRGSGDEDEDSGINSIDEEPDPGPEPDDKDCDRDKHSGKGHGDKKGKGHHR